MHPTRGQTTGGAQFELTATAAWPPALRKCREPSLSCKPAQRGCVEAGEGRGGASWSKNAYLVSRMA